MAASFVSPPPQILSFTEKATTVSDLHQSHCYMLKTGLIHHTFAAGRLISSAATIPSPLESSHPLSYAHSIFSYTQNPNSYCYNTMIRAYAKSPNPENSLILFEEMLNDDGVEPDRYTFNFALKACSVLGSVFGGKQVHGHVIKLGFEDDVYICNTLINLYGKCGVFEIAHNLLDRMSQSDVISWNAILSAHVEMGLVEKARGLFDEMPERNVESWNFMVSGYVKDGLIEEARRVFDEMPKRDVVSWNTIITGYSQEGQFDEVFLLFEDMQNEGIMPDDDMFVNVLSACARDSALSQGERIHAYINRNGIEVGGYLGTALVDMYSKCGSLEKALSVFRNSLKKDISTWNSMIAGLGQHGHGERAIEIFYELLAEGLMPNDVTFVCVLSACSRSGMLNEGRKIFDLMVRTHGIKPTIEHYGCLVDLLGRFGLLEEAEDLANRVPFVEAQAVWESLLGACRSHGDAERVERVARKLLEFDPQDGTGEVLKC